jgi:YD repeat-containing protein
MSRKRRLFRNLSGVALLTFILGVYVHLSGFGLLGIALYLGAVFLVVERTVLWRLRSANVYRSTARLRESVGLTIEESNLVRKTSAGAEEIRWANIAACHETKNLFLLQLDTEELLTLPKRAFSPGDQLRFKELRERELIVKTTRENPDSLLLKFAVAWGLVALLVMALCIGYLHTFLTRLPRPPQAALPPKPSETETKSSAARPDQLRGRGTVYLVPLGAVKSVALPALIEDIRKRYSLPLQLLPPVSPSAWARNSVRKQFVAEDLLTAMKLANPKPAADPEAMLIGLTDEDTYISGIDWQYAYSYRDEERFAIVSTAHLSEGEDDKPVPQDVLQKRVRKMLLQEIGVLYYRLQPNYDYGSIMNEDIEEASDLDDLSDEYLESDALVRADLHNKSGDPCFIVRHYTEPEREHPALGTLGGCSGYYKDRSLETVQIDLRYGLLLDQRTDFLVSDKIPLELTRVLRTQDSVDRAFGVGGNHSLNVFLVGDKWPFTWIDLIFEHGGRSHFQRSNWGVGYWDALYTNRDVAGSAFSGSTIQWAWPGWKIKRGATTYEFPDGGRADRPEQAALMAIQEHGGIRLTLTRDAAGNLLAAHSPTGKELAFQYDSRNRVIEVSQKGGGTFKYSYDSKGHLSQVTDADDRVTNYRQDEFGRISRIEQDGKTLCTLSYGGKDRVQSETMADGRTYVFRYIQGSDGRVAGVKITDTAGPTRQVRMSSVDYSIETVVKGEY